jgi:hypothetical protein
VIRTSDNELYSIVHISRGRGFTQYGGFPFAMCSDYHITGDEYKRRSKAPWPDSEPGTVTPPISTVTKGKAKKKPSRSRPPKPSGEPDLTPPTDPLDDLASDLE